MTQQVRTPCRGRSAWLALWAAALACVFASPVSAEPADVWMDVDTANGTGGDVDDGLALIQAFRSPELRLHGVSVVYGNAPLDEAVPIAQHVVEAFGPEGLGVYPGAASKGQLGEPTPAVAAMADALRNRPMTILALGPLTNAATLLMLHPELESRIERIIIVAGRRPGQRFGSGDTAFPDFNFEHDVEAMRVLLGSGVELALAPWEVSSHVWVSRIDLEALRRTGGSGAWIAETSQSWLERWEENIGPRGFNPFDTLAVALVTHPDLIETQVMSATIEYGPDDGARTRPWGDQGPKPYLRVVPVEQAAQRRPVVYAYHPDEAFKQVLLRRLAGRPGAASPDAASATE